MGFDKSYNYINCTDFRQLSAVGGQKQRRYPPVLGDKLVDCGIDCSDGWDFLVVFRANVWDWFHLLLLIFDMQINA